MPKLLLQRFARLIAIFILSSIIIFLSTEFLIINLELVLPTWFQDAEYVAQYREFYNLDQPLLRRYFQWMLGFINGELTQPFAFYEEESISTLIAFRLRNTLILCLSLIHI